METTSPGTLKNGKYHKFLRLQKAEVLHIILSNELYTCYKLIQLFRVTCFIACQYNTGLLWHITGIIWSGQHPNAGRNIKHMD